MSYIAYINGNQLDLSNESPIAYTMQVNDIASLSNRQSNFTHKFTVPFTATNKKAMDFVWFSGSQSNVPYKKNEFDLIDGDSGVHIIYKGWAVISQTTSKGYEINVYDGNIDFYKTIENLNLTQVNITDLDHVKNLANVINSWTNPLAYKYLISDYNGKNTFTSAGVINNINIDYQLPSARISYLWNRIFSFAGFTYTGSIFTNPKFLNLFMTFPKPVPTTDPIVTNITSQNSVIGVNSVWGMYGGTFTFYLRFFPVNFNTAIADNNIDENSINIKLDGSYRLKVENSITTDDKDTSIISWALYGFDTLGVWGLKSSGNLNSSIAESAIILAKVGDKLNLSNFNVYNATTSGSILTTFDLITGYNANFSQALVDFSCKDFVNEIMQRFGLTMIKDKYSNNIDFLTLEEIIQSNNKIDWSKKFSGKVTEKYIYGNYAIENNFRYRYNDENDSRNDGYFLISNENLKDSIDVINSKIYSPQPSFGYIGPDKNIYKFWNKELKDDGTIQYKELDGRYYFMRSLDITSSINLVIGSEILNTQQTITQLPVASFDRLKFQEIIYDFYTNIEAIINKSKVIEAEFYLKPIDIQTFNFKNLIFVEQLGSYFLVNKIMNFIKGKMTKCELVKVDYLKTIPIVNPTYITITNIVATGCSLEITFDTDVILPAYMSINGIRNYLITPNPATDFYDNTEIVTTNTITVTVPDGGIWDFTLSSLGIISNIFSVNNLGVCSFVPPLSPLTTLTITSIETLSVVGANRNIRVHYTSDFTDATMHLICTAFYIGTPITFNFYFATKNGYVDVTVANIGLGGVAVWNITLSALGITSNTLIS